MTDNVAVLEGYTEERQLVSFDGSYELFLLIRPGTDCDSRFRAWDTDEQEFIRVNGWMFVDA